MAEVFASIEGQMIKNHGWSSWITGQKKVMDYRGTLFKLIEDP
jgi:hypothetical protein